MRIKYDNRSVPTFIRLVHSDVPKLGAHVRSSRSESGVTGHILGPGPGHVHVKLRGVGGALKERLIPDALNLHREIIEDLGE